MGGPEKPNENEALTYIHDMLCQLKMLAQSSKQELLSYTIGMAVLESDRAMKAAKKTAGRKIARDSLYLPDEVD